MNNFYTYELCSSASPWLPFYVGKGFGNRMYVHKSKALKGTHYNKYLQNKILKILKEGNNIYYHKFNDNVSERIAFEVEKVAIETFRSIGVKLCNLTDGGEGLSGYKHTKKEIQKMSKNNKGKHTGPRSEEIKQKLRGKNNARYGKPAWNKGLKIQYSKETIRKIKEANKNNNHRSIPVKIINLHNKINTEYKSILEASKFSVYSLSSLHRALKYKNGKINNYLMIRKI